MTENDASPPPSGGEGTDRPLTRTPASPEPPWVDMVSESSTFSFELQRVFGRAVVDPAFRERLFSDPESVLAGMGMPADERGSVVGVGRDLFDSVVEGLRLELKQALAQLDVEQARIVELAKDWEAQIMAILPDEDEPGEPPKPSEGEQG